MDNKSSMEQNPFSREKAWQTYQENMRSARRLREEIRLGTESGENDRELLLRAVEALGFLTDNTILARIVRRSLEGREPS